MVVLNMPSVSNTFWSCETSTFFKILTSQQQLYFGDLLAFLTDWKTAFTCPRHIECRRWQNLFRTIRNPLKDINSRFNRR